MTARTEFYHNRPLTEDQLRKVAPSIFTTTARPDRSDKFRPIPTIEALRALATENFLPFAASQSRYRDPDNAPFVKHMIKLRKADGGRTPLHVGDNILEVILTNGNDGSRAYHLDAGVFRIACLNGLVVRSKDYGSVNVRHTGMDTLHRVLQGTHDIIEQADRVLSAPADWSTMIIDPDTRLAFAKAAHTARFGEDEPRITAAQLLIPRRPADTGMDLWTLLNVVQENTVEGGLSAIGQYPGATRRWTTRRVGAVEANLRLNQRLWALADDVARGKALEVAA